MPTPKISLLLSVFVLLLIIGFSLINAMNSTAQEPAYGERTPLATEDPIISFRATPTTEFDAIYNSLSIANFNIAYLLLEGAVAPDRFTAPQNVQAIFGADIFYEWDAFAAANEEDPYHVVMIHNSIFEQVDLTWTHWAYRNQIMLVGFSMPFDRIIALTGDQCITEINKGIWDDVEETFTFYTYFVHLEDEQYRDLMDERKLLYCDEQFDLNGTQAVISKSETLLGIEHLTMLLNEVIIITADERLQAEAIGTIPLMPPLVPVPNDDLIPTPTDDLHPISTPTP